MVEEHAPPQPQKKGIFISYSGPLSKQVAKELSTVLAEGLRRDIHLFPNERGMLMIPELLDGLAQSAFGICCMTRDNARSRWIHFEAGALLRLVPSPEGGLKHSPALLTRVVPFHYPANPARKGDQSDNPLGMLMGVQASAASVSELAQAIAKFFGDPTPDLNAIKSAWEQSEARLRDWEAKEAQELRVGRFSPFHGDIIDHCTEIDAQKNDFRKFLCDRMLRRVRDAAAELAHPRSETEFDDFHAFAASVAGDLDATTEIAALCGSKPWGEGIVSDYYRRQFEWARRGQGGQSGGPPWRMRRIFVQPGPMLKSAMSEAELEESRRNWSLLLDVAGEHTKHAPWGVSAAILQEGEMRQAVPQLETVWNNLIKDGFGFIAMRRLGRWRVLAHANRPNSARANRFIGARFDTEPVTSAALDLFENLWRHSDKLPASGQGAAQ